MKHSNTELIEMSSQREDSLFVFLFSPAVTSFDSIQAEAP